MKKSLAIKCLTLIEKPLTKYCIDKFNDKKTFLCLNHSFNKSGNLISSNPKKYQDISSIKTFE